MLQYVLADVKEITYRDYGEKVILSNVCVAAVKFLLKDNMNDFRETVALSEFAVTQQEKISKEIFEKYNTSHNAGILAAIRDAVWQGYCSGIADGKKLMKEHA